MQQPVIEEGAAYEPSVRSYDDLFPALPESNTQSQNHNTMGQWNNKMRVGSSVITQVFRLVFVLKYSINYPVILRLEYT
jgi:hypothetical protein